MLPPLPLPNVAARNEPPSSSSIRSAVTVTLPPTPVVVSEAIR